jgi:urocanate hydratase
VDEVIGKAMRWDVMGGVARRAWARNENALFVCRRYNQEQRETDHITLPFLADDDLVKDTVKRAFEEKR